MAKVKKNYTITIKNFSNAIIKTNRGFSNYYPYQELADYLEVSAEIEVNTVTLKTDFRDNSKIEWHYRLMRNESDSLANWQGFESACRLASEEAIQEAKNMIIKAVKSIKRIIKSGKNHPVYPVMAKIASEKIKHYNSDFLYHDTIHLAQLKAENSFIWIVRNCGSWLLTDKSDGCKSILNYSVNENKRRQESEKDLFYWYNGLTGNLIQISDITTDSFFNKI